MNRHLTLYPDVPSERTRQIITDLLVVVLIVFFCWVGLRMHDLVANLATLATGVKAAGTGILGGFDSVAGAVGGVPVVGGPLADAFHSAGEGTGGNIAEIGQAGEDAVFLLARAVGIIVAGLPTIVLLVAVLPRRLRGVREMSAAREVAGVDPEDPERARLLAMRAAFGLPFRELVQYTRDPFGDLAAGRYDALAEAALADVGLRPKKRR
jgi:hypothetical protein